MRDKPRYRFVGRRSGLLVWICMQPRWHRFYIDADEFYGQMLP